MPNDPPIELHPLLRLAERLLPGAVLLLYREDQEPALLSWPAGVTGRRESLEPLARLLCAAASAGGDLAVPSLARHRRFGAMPEIQQAGPLAFAAAPLPDSGSRGIFGVLRPEGAWTEDEMRVIGDLASSCAAVNQSLRLHSSVAALEETTAATEARYRQLLSSSTVAVIHLDRSLRIAEISDAACAIFGLRPQELLRSHVRHLLTKAGARRTWTEVRAALIGEAVEEGIEVKLPDASGEMRTVLLQVQRILVAGVFEGVRATARDVTEERARETQVRLMERVTSVAPLLSGVCHELNNPLTSIKSFAELLLLDPRSDDDREALEIVHREAQRAGRIVSDLRMIARQNQEASMQRELVDVNEVVRTVLESRAVELAEQNVELRQERATILPPTSAVRLHLEQVVSHLVSNAINAMKGRESSRILTVATWSSDRGVSLAVRDTGRGISEDNLSRIFDPFWTSRRPGEGTGLGLSLVHSIVSSHGGRIVANSQLDRGSTFTVELPMAGEAPPLVLAVEQHGASEELRVLVVDDEAPIRFSLARYLERRGHEVHQAADGNVALEMVHAAAGVSAYDVIVADLRMPGLDGAGMLARLRARGEGLEHRLIFMTGDPQSPCAARLLHDSGIPVMWKPFELAEVAQIIEAQARMRAA